MMIAALLPAVVRSAEAFDDSIDAFLFPEEVATLTNAVSKRRNEYSTGRRCAREALAQLGCPPAPVLTGLKREPLWPPGVVGSITHCRGYRAAAVARSAELTSVGIDAEPHLPLPDGVLRTIAVPPEVTQLAQLQRAEPGVHWDRLLFSAKESVYKAWFPLAQRWLGFEEAEVTLHPATGEFSVRLLVDGPRLADGRSLTGFTGRWAVARGLLLTTIVVPAVAVVPVTA